MKPNSAKSAKPLPEVEWNFYKLAEIETSLAFYYEYGRASETVKAEVEKMRANRRGHVGFYCPRNHRFWEVIDWLAKRDSFPLIPWLALPGEGIERLGFLRTQVNLRPSISLKHVWLGDEQAVRTLLSERARTFVPPSTGVFVPNPEASHFDIGVNWRLSDKEIIKIIEAIIKDSRPNQFKKYAKTPLVQGGFNGEILPFRKGAALQWLGVMRRRNMVKTWREFFDCFSTDKFSRGAECARMADCRKAKLILAWFDKGTPLKKEDFKQPRPANRIGALDSVVPRLRHAARESRHVKEI